MIKKRYYVSGIGLLPVLLFLFWPLASDKYHIETNHQALGNKREFLSKQKNDLAGERPNILLIVVDDLGLSDLSLYDNGYPQTPIIDRLGKEGVVLRNAYVTSSVCSPSRAAILTGRYQQRFGFQYQMHERYVRNRMEFYAFKYFIRSYPWIPRLMSEVPDSDAISQQGIPPSEILMPELLKTRGYETAIIGKWHLGSDSFKNPCRLGFDYQFGFYASHSLYAAENTPGIHDQKIKGDFTDPHIWSGQRIGAHAIYENCNEIHVQEYLTDRFADEAIKYINSLKSNPFFLYLSFNAPHTPLQAPEKFMEKFNHIADPVKRTYYAMIDNLDQNIGRVLKSIDVETLENTLIFFISDNGGAEYTFTTLNGNYKGGKITNLEGGIKVPFIVSWKNKLKPGVYENMVSALDIFQTIADVSGISLPDDRVYDGVNLLPFISGDNPGQPHDFLYWQRGFSRAIRDNRWKLCINTDAKDTVLFDLENDPFETTDVFSLNKTHGRNLALRHEQWSKTLPAPLWPSMVNYEFADGEKIYYFDQ